MTVRGKEQSFFVPVLLSLGLTFPTVGKASMSAPSVNGPPFIKQAGMFIKISGKDDPVCLTVRPGPAPFPHIMSDGKGIFLID